MTIQVTYGPRCEKTCLWVFANNKGADQPAHTRSLISAFVVPLKESIMYRHSTSEFSMSQSVDEQAYLNITLSETTKTGFVMTRPIW